MVETYSRQAQPESPFFATEYKSTEQHITLGFTALLVSLHQVWRCEMINFCVFE